MKKLVGFLSSAILVTGLGFASLPMDAQPVKAQADDILVPGPIKMLQATAKLSRVGDNWKLDKLEVEPRIKLDVNLLSDIEMWLPKNVRVPFDKVTVVATFQKVGGKWRITEVTAKPTYPELIVN